VCGTDLHILKGHWPKPLPWPRPTRFLRCHEPRGRFSWESDAMFVNPLGTRRQRPRRAPLSC
jgi:hypothetical protein